MYLLYLALTLVSWTPVHAQVEHTLFNQDGTYAKNYNQSIAKIQKLDNRQPVSILVGNNEILTDLYYDSSGDNSVFLANSERTRLYRFAKHKLQKQTGEESRDFLKRMLQTYEKLKVMGDFVVRFYPEESRPVEFIVSEYLKPADHLKRLITLGEEVLHWNFEGGVSKLQKIYDLRGLIEALEKFRFISDLHLDQIVYTDRGWVLLDFGGSAISAGEPHEGDALWQGSESQCLRFFGLLPSRNPKNSNTTKLLSYLNSLVLK